MIGTMLLGALSRAAVAAPRSPAKPAAAPPANVKISPLVVTRRIRLLAVSATRNEPSGRAGTSRLVERGAGGGVAAAAEAGGPVAGHRGDHAVRSHAADAVVAGVRDEEAAVGGGGDAAGGVQAGRRVGGRERVAGEAARRARGRAGPGDGRDRTVVADAADAVVRGVRDQ